MNIIFAKGVELLQEGLDDKGLLEGTGKQARHIKVRSEEILKCPTTRKLIAEAVKAYSTHAVASGPRMSRVSLLCLFAFEHERGLLGHAGHVRRL